MKISKTYDPKKVEAKWYDAWLKDSCFTPQKLRCTDKSKGAYSIVMPPPNVTGVLHMGHVLNNTIQDILVRKARLEGRCVLWIPGTDHAGIATQVMVEKHIMETEGKTRQELGREEFLKRVWEWKDEKGSTITNQLKKLGCSCDWTRERFTMDEEYTKLVQKVFVHLYRKGLIYRGKKMVNWCPASQTALSDEEVIMTPQKGKLYYFKAVVKDSEDDFLTIATTRPETIPGDVAVAVNPKDKRYAKYIGKLVRCPLTIDIRNRFIPVIGDESVDMEFGTGVLKITPAHDKTDFEIAQRHNLPIIDIMNPDGTMNEQAWGFTGLTREQARVKAVDILKSLGWLVKVEDYDNVIGISQRGNVPIEPRLSEQWFLKCPCVEEAKRDVVEGEIKFYPEHWVKTYVHWLDNIQDWCISRQLWWGHRIPVWYNKEDKSKIYCDINPPEDIENWEQDPDVLDTWFSSWLWSFATMGWDFNQLHQPVEQFLFHPTSTLVTGPDIIFFWVARMIMASEEFTGQIPFKNVYFTGIVRDKQGRKMSKTLGNSPDPIELIDKYGADALRFGIIRSAPFGQDVLFDEKDVELGRNFCNKIWNAARFTKMLEEKIDFSAERFSFYKFSDDDLAMIFAVLKMESKCNEAIKKFEFNTYAQTIQAFFWNDFCDWFIEVCKQRFSNANGWQQEHIVGMLFWCWYRFLTCLSPLMPFISEELSAFLGLSGKYVERLGRTVYLQESSWFNDTYKDDEELMKSMSYPTTLDKTRIENSQKVREFISQLRGLKAKENSIFITPKSDEDKALIEANKNQIEFFTKLTFTFDTLPSATATILTNLGTVSYEAETISSEEIDRMKKELAKLNTAVKAGEKKLSSKKFVKNAPKHIVEGAKKILAETTAKRDELQKQLSLCE